MMLPAARPPLLLSSILGGLALLLFIYSLKPAEVSTAPAVVWETRTAGRASRRLQGGHGAVPPSPPTSSQSVSELDDTARNTGVAPPPLENKDAEAGGKRCWIFMHLQKCGGSTVKKMLHDAWGTRFFIYDSMRWKYGDEFSRGFGEKLASGHPWNVMAGGYTEALGRSAVVNASCRFFTLFRHPISRLVSAYFYCQVLENDVACASNIVRAREVDLVTFAKHWSNFAVRQFALSMVPADDVMAYVDSPEARALLPDSIESLDDVAGWYLLKMYLERPGAEDSGTAPGHQPQWETTGLETRPTGRVGSRVEAEEDERVPDAQLYDFLQPAQALLSERYEAVGILESWNTTLSLFDKALDMPEVDWQHDFQQDGRQNVDLRFQKLKAETLEKAWTDQELKKYMQLDLLLYDHAVDVFHEQARSHGLFVPE